MGWASAGDIFDPVAQALIDVGASDEIKTRTCSALIKALQSRDWDTENESLSKFANDPSIVAAFRENGIIIGYLRGDPRLQAGEESDPCGAGQG